MSSVTQFLDILVLVGGGLGLLLVRFLSERSSKARPLLGVAWLLFLYLLGNLLRGFLSRETMSVVGPYYTAAMLVLLSFALIRLATWLLFDMVLPRRRKVETADIIKQLAVAVLFAVALIVILRNTLNINLASLITTSAVLSIIIGLALQDTLANMFAGLSLQVEKPFAIGDWISFETFTGRVEEINWRTTTIQPLSHDHVVIPNTVIAKSVLTNYSRPNRLHVLKPVVEVELDAPPNRVKAAVMRALRDDPDISWKTEPQVRLLEYRDFGVRYEIRFFITDFSRHLVIADNVLTRVWYHLRREGIRIPYPVRDVRVREVTPAAEDAVEKDRLEKTSETLRRVDFLSPLSREEIALLASHATLYMAHRGEVIIRQGDEGDSCFAIRSGEAEVWISTPGGPRKVGTLGPGQVFGEMSLMTGEGRTATVKALTDMEIVLVGKNDFSHVLADNPEIAGRIGEVLARRQLQLDETSRATQETLEDEALSTRTSQLVSRIRRFFRV